MNRSDAVQSLTYWYDHGVRVELTPDQERAARRATKRLYGNVSIKEGQALLAGYRLALEDALKICTMSREDCVVILQNKLNGLKTKQV